MKIVFNFTDFYLAFNDVDPIYTYKVCPKVHHGTEETDSKSHWVAHTIPLVSGFRSQEYANPQSLLKVSLAMSWQWEESWKTLISFCGRQKVQRNRVNQRFPNNYFKYFLVPEIP